jgi:hypothetical protein
MHGQEQDVLFLVELQQGGSHEWALGQIHRAVDCFYDELLRLRFALSLRPLAQIENWYGEGPGRGYHLHRLLFYQGESGS